MKLSLAWLKEYVAVRLSPQQIAERLTMAGLEVTDRRVVGEDVLFDCEVTPNRPDWLSHVGVARELAAITGARGTMPSTALPKSVAGARPRITIQDRKACRRYVGTLIEGVVVGPSPAWLRRRLDTMGIRSINNVVDVTNFVLFELGQPLHAFDADRLAKGQIVVRRAAAGERLVTIDGVERRLDPSILVIADAERPVAAAGIMGGQGTEVTVTTRRVLLESAWFDPLVVRRAGRTLGLASESSYRFERGADLEQVAAAARRAAALIVEIAGGRVVGGPVDRRTARARPQPIVWQPEQAAALGTAIPAVKQRWILERLGCRVVGRGSRWRAATAKGSRTTARWLVTPPSYRGDLKQPVDLLEELARLTGYERLPVTLPRPVLSKQVFAPEESADLRHREGELRQWLVASGLDEIVTYSLIGPADLERIRWRCPQLPIRLQNPLSHDRSLLRPTQAVGALEAVARNLNRKAPGVAFFELGRTYHQTGEGVRLPPAEAAPRSSGQPEEQRTLTIALAGLRPSSWDAKPSPWTLFHATGMLETLAQRLRAAPIPWQPGSHPCFLEGTVSYADGAVVGVVEPAVAAAFDIPAGTEVVLAELIWPRWWGQLEASVMFKPLAKVPPVTRDLAIVVNEAVTHAQIESVIRAAGGPLLQSVTLFDTYRGSQVPAGQKSHAYTVAYSAGDRTLTDAEVTAAQTAIVEALKTQLQATLRTQLGRSKILI